MLRFELTETTWLYISVISEVYYQLAKLLYIDIKYKINTQEVLLKTFLHIMAEMKMSVKVVSPDYYIKK